MSETAITSEDIIFDCPHCGKSLAIDSRGAGLGITCPDCHNSVQVPSPEEMENDIASDTRIEKSFEMDAELLSDALAASRAKVQELVENLAEVTRRRNYLEQQRVEHLSRFENIGKELTIIQGAMDRMVDALQGARNGQ